MDHRREPWARAAPQSGRPLGPSGPAERETPGPERPRRAGRPLGPSGPAERRPLGPSGPAERETRWTTRHDTVRPLKQLPRNGRSTTRPRPAIAEAEEYLQLLYSIDYIFRRHSLDIDVETAERYVDLLYRIKNLSAFIPDEDDVARLEHHVAQLERRRTVDREGGVRYRGKVRDARSP
jgi:hypothetical protein